MNITENYERGVFLVDPLQLLKISVKFLSSKSSFQNKNMSQSAKKSRSNICIRGARVNNLKNISIDIPRDQVVVVTGMSGSGKSSLAFDLVYAEGNRRYLEGMSSYARQFLDVAGKVDVDKIENLSPTISIDQKSVSRSPRSTVGTMTEIYDYLRLIYSKVGVPHCPKCNLPMERMTNQEILGSILNLPDNTQVAILARTISFKENPKELVRSISQLGYSRVRVEKKIMNISEVVTDMALGDGTKIEIVIDRLVFKKKNTDKERILDSIETAFKLGRGFIAVVFDNQEENFYSRDFVCPECFFKVGEITPRHFSFNNPEGACQECSGLGMVREIDERLVLPNLNLSFSEGAIAPLNRSGGRGFGSNGITAELKVLGEAVGFTFSQPVKTISPAKMKIIFEGTKDGSYPRFEGLTAFFKRKYNEIGALTSKSDLEKYFTKKTCPECQGKRLKKEYLTVYLAGKSIDQLAEMNLVSFEKFLRELEKAELSYQKKEVVSLLAKEMLLKVKSLENVGLEYLSLSRGSDSISGGEAQRIRLATQIGSELSQVIYVLDEPSIGLHNRDTEKLIGTMQELKKCGNSLIVVEHDENIIRSADWVIDMGPGAGEEGGEIIFEGSLEKLLRSKTATASYLTGCQKVFVRKKSNKGNGKFLEIIGAGENNLKDITVKIPLGKFVSITGVSGSGKSTLVSGILAKALSRHFFSSKDLPGKHKKITGLNNIDKVIHINQSPIGRTPRSNAATYTGVFSLIRDAFSATQEARSSGFDSGRFSFNMRGGRCEDCQGEGTKKIEMHLLPDMYVSCETCGGTRYNQRTLDIEYQGVNVAQVLDMNISYAARFFKNSPLIWEKLKTLEEVGLGYLKLGQSATNLSGGEAQRIKLATELSRKSTGKTLYILDEPTIGLHFEDVKKLLGVLSTLSEKGNTVLVVEHNLDVIRNSDWVIDLGPEGGEGGGEVVYAGAPEGLKKCKRSWTGKYI